MIGTTHTLKRLVYGVALTAALAAVAVPAGLAAASPFQSDTVNSARVGNGAYALDPAIATAIAAHRQATYSLPGSFQSDTVNSARVATGSYALDPGWVAAIAAHRQQPAIVSYSLPSNFQTDTVSSARVAPVVERVPTSGFDWGSFGIGIGAGVGGLLLLGGLAARVRPLRRLAKA